MKKFVADYGLYLNCHISSTESHTIEASDFEEAKAKAERLGDEIEDSMSSKHPHDDCWAHLEDLYQEEI